VSKKENNNNNKYNSSVARAGRRPARAGDRAPQEIL